MKYPTPEADAFTKLCRGIGVRPDDAVPIIKKLEIKLAQKRAAHDVTRHALKLKSTECIHLKEQLATLSKTHAKDRQRLDELLSDFVRDKRIIGKALGLQGEDALIHSFQLREIQFRLNAPAHLPADEKTPTP